jgi:hypothetical protein
MANLQPATYYLLSVGTDCSAGYQRTQMFLTDGDWCDGAQFTDTGGTTSNYGDSQTIVKTLPKFRSFNDEFYRIRS